MEVTATLIDVCLSCFLTDHHNRPGELLVGAYVDGNTPLAEVQSQLIGELNDSGWDRAPDLNVEDAAMAIRELFAGHDDLSVPFDASLEIVEDDDSGGDEMCQAWVLLSWEPAEGGDAD